MPVWPATLPQYPLQEGFKETAPNTVTRTEMDAGPAKLRRRFTAAPRPFTLNLDLTETQAETLDAFYLTTLEGGSLSFDWLHPRTKQTATFRFLSPPDYTPSGGLYWTATVNLELMP